MPQVGLGEGGLRLSLSQKGRSIRGTPFLFLRAKQRAGLRPASPALYRGTSQRAKGRGFPRPVALPPVCHSDLACPAYRRQAQAGLWRNLYFPLGPLAVFPLGGTGLPTLPTAGRRRQAFLSAKRRSFAERPFVLLIMSVWKRCFAPAFFKGLGNEFSPRASARGLFLFPLIVVPPVLSEVEGREVEVYLPLAGTCLFSW